MDLSNRGRTKSGSNSYPLSSSPPISVPGNPPIAQARPKALSVAGEGGVADSSPSGTALVGKKGMALAAPSSIAIAGPDTPITLTIDPGQGQHKTKKFKAKKPVARYTEARGYHIDYSQRRSN